jgi:hypothetical protein
MLTQATPAYFTIGFAIDFWKKNLNFFSKKPFNFIFHTTFKIWQKMSFKKNSNPFKSSFTT